MTLDELRERLAEVDRKLVELVAERQRLSGEVAAVKHAAGLPTRDFPMLAEWYRQGKLNLDDVVTRTIGLGDTEEAFAAMERGETLRSVIVL